MNDNLKFTVPDKICPKCGDVIPVAGDRVLGKDGKPKILRTSRLLCECWRTGTPRPRILRRRKGEHSEDQQTILTADCPVIHL